MYAPILLPAAPATVISSLAALRLCATVRVHGRVGLMCRTAAVLLLILVWPVPDALPRSQAEAPDFLQLEEVWNDAHLKGDVRALADLWAEDLTVIVPSMARMDKKTSLRFWQQTSVRFTQYESSNVAGRLIGDTAIVTGNIHRVRDFGGRTSEDFWQFTKVYVRQGERWRVTAFHASEAPK